MTNNPNNGSNHDLQHRIEPEQNNAPRWKRAHHSIWFWIFLLLMIAGITYYVMSLNFALAPQKQVKQPIENTVAP